MPYRTVVETELSNLLMKEWYSYDKKVTSVIRSMGFNSVKKYVDSNQKRKNYYRIIKEMNSEPKNGVNGIYSNLQELTRSTQFKSILWIEDNVDKYLLSQTNETSLDITVKAIEDYIDGFKQLPFIKSVAKKYVRTSNTDVGILSSDKKKSYIELKIGYSPTIAYHKSDYSYHLNVSGTIWQTIKINLTKINLNTLENGTPVEILNEMILEKDLRDAFMFSGPCMFVSQSNQATSPTPGCIGNRSTEYNEICKSKDLNRYIMFITDWIRNYTAGETGPYRKPKSLVNNYGFLGLTDPSITELDARGYNSDSCRFNFSTWSKLKGREYLEHKDLAKQIGFKNANEVCMSCVKTIDNCKRKKYVNKLNNAEIKPEGSLLKNPDITDLMNVSNKIYNVLYKGIVHHESFISSDEPLEEYYQDFKIFSTWMDKAKRNKEEHLFDTFLWSTENINFVEARIKECVINELKKEKGNDYDHIINLIKEL